MSIRGQPHLAGEDAPRLCSLSSSIRVLFTLHSIFLTQFTRIQMRGKRICHSLRLPFLTKARSGRKARVDDWFNFKARAIVDPLVIRNQPLGDLGKRRTLGSKPSNEISTRRAIDPRATIDGNGFNWAMPHSVVYLKSPCRRVEHLSFSSRHSSPQVNSNHVKILEVTQTHV